jgi:hypothetical protein
MVRRYAVLRCGLKHGQVIPLLEAGLRRLRSEHDLDFCYAYAEDDADTRQEVWLEHPSETAVVRLVNYRPISMIYLVIEAVRGDQFRAMGALVDRLPIQSLAELQTAARQCIDLDPTGLIRLAVGAGDQADPVSRSIIAEALSNSTRAIRLAAAMAAGVTRWPDLVPELEVVARREADERVRRMMQGALDCCRNGPISDADGDLGEDCENGGFRALSAPYGRG